MRDTVENDFLFPLEAVFGAMTRVNRMMEEWIRARPGQWLWRR